MNNGPHLTTEGISAAFEELLPEREQRAADAHLAGCARCQAVLDELIGVRRALHQIGNQAPPMPRAVQDRLEAVLAAESAARRQSGVHTVPRSAPVPAPQGGPRTTGRGSHRSKHVAPRSKPRSRKRTRSRGGAGRILVAAAGLVVLAVGSLVTYQTIFAGKQQQTSVVSQPSLTASTPTNRPADKYRIDGVPKFTGDKPAAEVDEYVKPGERTRPKVSKPSKPGVTVQKVAPQQCAELAVGREGVKVLDSARATYNGQSAYLVIAESSKANSVRAYLVTNCPQPAEVERLGDVAISN